MADIEIFDRKLLARRRKRALDGAVPGADFLLKTVSEDLGDRLAVTRRSFGTALDLGGHCGRLIAVLQNAPNVENALRGDLFLADPNLPAPDLVLDDTLLPFGQETLDLIVSALSLHHANDLPGALIQIRRALKPDGLFLATLLGADSLHELRDVLMQAELELTGGAAPRVAPFPDTRDLGALLQRAGFNLPVTDVDRLTVRYDTMFDLMRDLRAMGATSVLKERSRSPLPRAVFLRAAELYAENHSDPDGRIRASFNVVSLSGWAPHKSQQKPLRPGSAKQSLAEALGTKERPA